MAFHRRLPSPAVAISFLALIGALAGTAVALPGKNTVDSGDIKTGAVRSGDIRNNAVRSGDISNNGIRSGDIRDGAVGSADIQNNSVGGADVDESSLGAVPTANTANVAGTAGSVNGQVIAKFQEEIGDDDPAVTVIEIGGLKLTANCPGGIPNLDASSTSGVDGTLQVEGMDNVTPFQGADDHFGGLDVNDVTPAGVPSWGSGNASALFANGTVVTVVFGYRDDGFTTNSACRYYGHVLVG